MESIKLIMKTIDEQFKAEQDLAILKQRIYTRRLPPSYNTIDHSMDNIEQALNRTIIDENMRTTLLARRSKTIAQFKYDMLVLTVATIEERIHACRQIISNEKVKLVSRNPSTTFESVLTFIDQHQNLVQKRFDCILQWKMSFFEYAPMDTD